MTECEDVIRFDSAKIKHNLTYCCALMPYLAFNLNNGNEFIFDLVEDRLSLGRNSRNEIVIENTYISSFHAELVKQPDGAYEVTDLKSANGIFINGKRIEKAVMKPDDKVRFGQLDARYRDSKLPGVEKEKRGAAPTAEEKREEAQASEGHGTKTELIHLSAPSSVPSEAPKLLDAARAKIVGLSPTQPPSAKAPVAKPVAVPTAKPVSTTTAKTPTQVTLTARPLADESIAQRVALQNEIATAAERLVALKTEVASFEKTKTELATTKTELDKLRKEIATLPPKPAALERGKEAVASEGHIKVLHTEIEQLERAKTEYAAIKLELDKEKTNLADTKNRIATHYDTEKKLREKLAKESRATEEYLATLEKEIAESKTKLAATKKEVVSSEADTAQLAASTGTQITGLTKSLTALKTEHDGLSATVAELAAKRTEHEKHFADITPKLDATRKELVMLSKQRDDAGSQFKKTSDELAAAAAKLKAAQTETAQRSEELAVRKKELESAIAGREEELKVIELRVADFDAKRNAAEKHMMELAATDSRLGTASEALKLVQEQQTAAEVALAHLTVQHDQEKNERSETAAKLAALAREHDKAEEKIKALEKQEATHEQSVAEAKARVEKTAQESAALVSELEDAYKKKQDELERAAAAKFAEIEKITSAKLTEKEAVQSKLREAETRHEELTKKSAEHAGIEGKLASARQTLASTEARHNEINGLLVSLLAQRSDHESALARLKDETRQHEAELTKFKGRTEIEQSQIKQLHTQHAEEKTRFEELRILTGEAEKKLTTRRGELEREIADRESDLKSLQERLQLLQQNESEVMRKVADLATTDTRLTDVSKALNAVEEQKAVVEKHLLALGRQREASEKEISLLAERGAAQHTLVQTLGKQRAGIEQNLAQLQCLEGDAEKRSAEIDARTRQVEQQLTARQLEFGNGIKEREDKIYAADAKLKELQTARAAAEKRLMELGEVSQQLVETREKFRAAEQQRETVEATVSKFGGQAEQHKAAQQKLEADAKQKEAEVLELVAKQNDLKSVIARLSAEHDTHQKHVDERLAEATALEKTLVARNSELATTQKTLAEARQRHTELQGRIAQLSDTESRLKAVEQTLDIRNQEITRANGALAAISKEHSGQAAQLGELRRKIEDESHKASELKRQQDEARALLQMEQETRAIEEKKSDAARVELQTLVELFAVKKSEADATARHLDSASEKLAATEKRQQELQHVEAQLKEAQSSLVSSEKQRDAGQLNLSELGKHQEKLRGDIVKLLEQEKSAAAKADDASNRAKAEDTRFSEAQKRAEKALAELEATEAHRVEAARALSATKDEEKAIRAGMPGLSAETAAAQTALHELLGKRSAEESHRENLNAEVQAATRRLKEIKQLHDATAQSHAATEQQLRTVREQLAQHEAKAMTAHIQSTDVEQRLAAMQKQMQEREGAMAAQLGEAKRKFDDLRREEQTLSGSIQQKLIQLQGSESDFDDVKKKLAVSEVRLAEFLSSGPRVLSLSEAIAELETRHRETSKIVSQAAEQDLALQVKLNSLTENNKKESQRAELFRKETAIEEDKLRQAVAKSQDEIESARRQLTEKMQREETELSARVKSRVSELQEKHEMLRHTLALGADETTVIMFGNDLIKRIDLIDILIKRYSAQGTGGGVDQQLSTLRASFEDILAQHGIHEFFVDAGTEVGTDLRARISVVENISGNAKAKVVECFRPGYIYKTHGGREVILRKVEVKTSSA